MKNLNDVPIPLLGLAIAFMSACSTMEDNYRWVQQENSISSYEKFLNAYPNTPMRGGREQPGKTEEGEGLRRRRGRKHHARIRGVPGEIWICERPVVRKSEQARARN